MKSIMLNENSLKNDVFLFYDISVIMEYDICVLKNNRICYEIEFF